MRAIWLEFHRSSWMNALGLATTGRTRITLEVIAGPKLRLREGDYVVDV